MLYYATKVLLTAGLIVLASEVAKRSSMFGALLASVPLTSLAVMIWLYVETGDEQKVSAFSLNVFWLVIPSLALFLLLPLLIRFGWGFWLSVIAAVLATAACYGMMLSILKHFGA
ncbi:MAG: hypothetical protein A3H31_08465 [Gallionellales bacterium RIFCSPLOWO2_02_FULL_57_47]|nr:MAG: hypothetical protein A3H31_08465 [Gallionellales bacterium RIFCSPLOWO2_02_FULL_57_47]OGT13052.1 MAG: hypothetical protein A3J49_08055 [Gallionellales bacterium RIFCSPHIGHO2_02_FULL_57_16]